MPYRVRPTRALILAATACLAAFCALSCSRDAAAAAKAPVVVIITGSETATPLEFRGAEDLVRAYSSGAANSGGVPIRGDVRHIEFPDKARGEDSVSSFIADAASDPRVAAIVVAPSPAGTASGLRKAKKSRGSGFLCVAASSSEDVLDIESSADLVVELDRASRAYVVAWAAKKLGARSIVAAYGLAESAAPDTLRERAIMSVAASDLGLRYAAMVAPKGVEGSAFVRSASGSWLRDYGPTAALYCADPSLAQSLISGAVAGGGILIDAGGAATVQAYAEALGVDLSLAKGDAKKERRLVEAALDSVGMKGKLCSWDLAYGRGSASGLGEFAMRVARGEAKKDEINDLRAALDARSGGAAWMAEYDVDAVTGVKSLNRVLVRQDLYALGSGYLQSALQPIPPKYLLLKSGGAD